MKPKLKIGIFGSATESTDHQTYAAVIERLGKALARHHDTVVVVTGACMGIPYAVAHEAAQAGTEVWGFSPKFDLEGQKLFTPDGDLGIYSKLVYVPRDYAFAATYSVCIKYRNVSSTASCDAGIIVSGRWGSLNEFTNLIDMQKLVGVLTGTGGIADELPALSKKITKAGQGEVLFESDPDVLVEAILNRLG